MSRESIAGKTTWTVVISCAVLGLVSLAIGLGVYSNQMIRMFIHHAYNTALHASMSVENGTEAEPYAKKIMEIYRSLTPEERAMTGTQEYRERFLCGETAPEKDTRDSLIRALESFIMRCLGPFWSAVMKGRLISASMEVERSFLAFSAASFRRCRAMLSAERSMPFWLLKSSTM